jgi:hypothetical protein
MIEQKLLNARLDSNELSGCPGQPLGYDRLFFMTAIPSIVSFWPAAWRRAWPQAACIFLEMVAILTHECVAIFD